MEKKVLIVAYSFPPTGGAGVQRPAKFVKYLRKFSWEPLVLTVSNPSVPVQDFKLAKEIPEGIKIFKARTLEPSYEKKKKISSGLDISCSKKKSFLKKMLLGLLLPDCQVLWWPSLIFKMIKIYFFEKPDVFFVTGPPFSSFIPVVVIGNIFRVPVVIDFRDEWIFNRKHIENSSKLKIAKKLDFILERFCLQNCSKFIVATKSYGKSIFERHSKIEKFKCNVITNGFDEDDFIKAIKIPKYQKSSKKLTIVYTGTLWKATSLKTFIIALEKAVKINFTLKDKICIKIFGRVVDDEMTFLKTSFVGEMFELNGYLGHEEVIKEMLTADLLLLTLSDLLGAEKIIPAKTFEYVATSKPVLALIPDGEAKNVLLRYCAESFIPRNENELIEFIHRFENIFNSKDKKRGEEVASKLEELSRKNLTRKLSLIFDECIDLGGNC